MPISRVLVKALITRSFSAQAVAPRCMAGLMAADGSVDRWRRFSLAGSVRKWGSAGFPALAVGRQKILCLRPGASRRSRSTPVSRLSALFRRSGNYGHRNLAQAQNMLVQTNRAGGAAALPVSVVFRHHCRLSSDVNWFPTRRLLSFGSADPDSSGRRFCAGFSRLSGTRWSIAGVGSNQHSGKRRPVSSRSCR